MKNVHVTKHDKGWQVKEEKTGKVLKVAQTQAEAIKAGTKIAKSNSSEIFVHGRDGKIRERNTFGNDPFPPKG